MLPPARTSEGVQRFFEAVWSQLALAWAEENPLEVQMKSKTVEAIIRQGIRSLIMSMTESYWPAVGDNDMSERNITAHVGHCFLESGWHLVTEVSFRKTPGLGLTCLLSTGNSEPWLQ